MKKYFPFASALILLFVSLGVAQAIQKSKKGSLVDALAKRETKLWEAWKKHQAAPFQNALSADTVLVGDMGILGKDDSIKGITSPECTVQDFALSDFKVTIISKDVALLTYKATQHVTCSGTQQPTDILASSIWVKRGGKWYAAFHQETPAAGQ